jgi:hypothetical protein
LDTSTPAPPTRTNPRASVGLQASSPVKLYPHSPVLCQYPAVAVVVAVVVVVVVVVVVMVVVVLAFGCY